MFFSLHLISATYLISIQIQVQYTRTMCHSNSMNHWMEFQTFFENLRLGLFQLTFPFIMSHPMRTLAHVPCKSGIQSEGLCNIWPYLISVCQSISPWCKHFSKLQKCMVSEWKILGWWQCSQKKYDHVPSKCYSSEKCCHVLCLTSINLIRVMGFIRLIK